MNWNYNYPTRKWYETDDEYQERVEAYEKAEYDYIEEKMEDR